MVQDFVASMARRSNRHPCNLSDIKGKMVLRFQVRFAQKETKQTIVFFEIEQSTTLYNLYFFDMETWVTEVFALRVLLKERLTSASIGVVTLERNIADEVYFAVETNHCTCGKIISYRYIPAGLHSFVGNVLKQNSVIKRNLNEPK